MIKYIDVNCPISRGKPMPKFNPKMVNEDRFEDELRPKDFYICLDTDHNVCNVEWLSQEADYFSDDLSAELIRALKANGARLGTEVYVKYGIRDYGLRYECNLTV